MAGKREQPEDIVLKLRQVEVLQGQGKPVSDAVRQIGVTVQTYYRWRKEYGGMNRDQLKRLKELETENERLRRAVPDLILDKMIFDGSCPGKLLSPSRRRQCIDHVRQTLRISERRACRTLVQHRSTQRKVPLGLADEERLTEAQILIERWRRHYNTIRPHSALNYRPPTPEAFVQIDQRPTMH